MNAVTAPTAAEVAMAAREEFMKVARGHSVYRVAMAMSSLTGYGTDFRGCNKSAMATAWAERQNRHFLYRGMSSKTAADLAAAIERAAKHYA